MIRDRMIIFMRCRLVEGLFGALLGYYQRNFVCQKLYCLNFLYESGLVEAIEADTLWVAGALPDDDVVE
jgi:hypothetical protein